MWWSSRDDGPSRDDAPEDLTRFELATMTVYYGLISKEEVGRWQI
jgi:hypothetical protein